MKKTALMAETVYDRLCANILGRRLAEGDRLNIDELVKAMGVSQTPLRQALMQLQFNGLVTNKPNAGFRIAALPTKADILEALSLRILIEPSLAEEAALRVSKSDIDRLEASLDEFATASVDDERYLLHKLDAYFHTSIAKIANRKTAANLLGQLTNMWIFFPEPREAADLSNVVQEHRAIVDALKQGNSMSARVSMEYHLRSSVVHYK